MRTASVQRCTGTRRLLYLAATTNGSYFLRETLSSQTHRCHVHTAAIHSLIAPSTSTLHRAPIDVAVVSVIRIRDVLVKITSGPRLHVSAVIFVSAPSVLWSLRSVLTLLALRSGDAFLGFFYCLIVYQSQCY